MNKSKILILIKLKTQNLKYWGHNCFSVESNTSILLIDPWFSEKGALVHGFNIQKIII